ncbi:Putative Mg2+ and Co2+ transporter CorB [uncultured Ruminococcus sp.]|nr:hemolysin family protein [Massiliimalia timonensis]SCI06747.1 Putative Mg2+ and Co2+ transporter CorB [uncultured Clostridium sp.]SCI38108.1 Putative Mg2+ and Co2+ transporter CorB [uncultured Ruminococcus sp.]
MGDIPPLIFVLLVFLIAMSAFFSGTETAFATVNRIRMKNIAAAGNKKANKVIRIADEYDRALSALLIGNNIVNIASASIGTVIFTTWFGPSGAGISTLVMTIVVLIFGEILPKTYAKQNAESLALRVVNILDFFIKLFSPLIFLFLKLTSLVTRNGETTPSVTEQELKFIIEESENEGVLEQQESELVQSALDFDEITVEEILTPRVDVVAVEEQEDPERVKSLFFEEGYSRLPVYSGSIDHVVGVVHNKDFFRAYVQNQQVSLNEIMQNTVYVPPKKLISELMKELQRLKSHMAIVTDQYGGTIGIITLEDIIEELVGEIWDESDEEETPVVKLSENRYQVSGDLDPEDFFDEIDYDYPEQDFEELNSFAGWALETLERIPEPGASFTYRDMEILVKEVTDQRIVTLEVIFHPKEEITEKISEK